MFGVKGSQTLPLAFSKEVLKALRERAPIIALESSTVVKSNSRVMLDMEALVRDLGATPATIAQIGGQIRVGLTREEIYSLETGKLKVRRIGRKDIATSIVLKESAVTKGSAAMLIAHQAGIKVLVTSDFQGVGLEAGTSYKVSPDIMELGRTPIAVICSGTANTMDVGKTLGVQNSFGVETCAFRQQNFPAHYSRDSGFQANTRLGSIEQAADVVYKQFYVLNMGSGILIGNPPADSPDSQIIEDSIKTALTDARDQQILPSGLTEFLTTALPTYCENKSQTAFLKNLESNIKLGVKISQTVQKTIQSNFEALQKKNTQGSAFKGTQAMNTV